MLAFKYGVGQDCPGCSAFVLCLLRTSTVGVCTGTCIVIHYLNSHQSQLGDCSSTRGPCPLLGKNILLVPFQLYMYMPWKSMRWMIYRVKHLEVLMFFFCTEHHLYFSQHYTVSTESRSSLGCWQGSWIGFTNIEILIQSLQIQWYSINDIPNAGSTEKLILNVALLHCTTIGFVSLDFRFSGLGLHIWKYCVVMMPCPKY